MKKLTFLAVLSVLSLAVFACSQGDWRLTSGTPPYADPDPLVYEGDVQLTGWLIYQPAYVGEDEPHFHVSNTEGLPEPVRESNFQIEASENLRAEILQSTEENPITIHATKILVNIEGSPVMTMKE